jgi:hypothetical protein
MSGIAKDTPFAGTYMMGVVGETLVLPLSQQGNHVHGQFVSYVHSGPGKAAKHLGAVVDGQISDTITASLTVGCYSCTAKLEPTGTLRVECDTVNPALREFSLRKVSPQQLKDYIKDTADYPPLPPAQ